jgi:serine/threonine-protein kinase
MGSREKPGDDAGDTVVGPAKRERLGRYVLHHKLGRGGMATVYLGRMVGEKGFERWVAVKRMHEHLLEDEDTRRMFLDEARMAARLQHSNLVQVTDFGEVAGQPYLVMEYINGETLSAILRKCHEDDAPLPIPLAIRIVAWACEGLHHAHELTDAEGEPLHLVHRDVSPQNILVSYDGTVKVTDFGIAKAAGRLQQQTRTGQMKGKTAYMSPEQVFAQPLDRRADVFALGIVLYEATLGRRLFRDESELVTLQRITAADVPPPRSIDARYPPELERIVLKALEKMPEDRYATTREMQRELERLLLAGGLPVGTAELADLMESRFVERRRIRAQMMRAAELVEPDAIDVELELSPTTLSLPERVAVTLHPRRWSRRTRLVAVLAGVVVVVGLVGGLVAAGVRPGEGSRDGGAVAATARADAAPRDDSGRARPADAGAAPGPRPQAIVLEAGAAPEAGAASDAGAAGRGDGAADAGPPPTTAPTRPRERTERVASAPGTLSVMARPWCDVYLDGRRLGRTPLIRVPVPSGRRTLRFLPLGREPAHRRVVTVRPGQDTPFSVDLTGE